MTPEASYHRRRIGGLLASGRLPWDYTPEGKMTREERKEVADRSWRQEPRVMCPHCGQTWAYWQLGKAAIPGMIPDHAYPETAVGGRLCPGSGQGPRNPETDRRPLWKDLPGGREPTEHERKSTAEVSPGLASTPTKPPVLVSVVLLLDRICEVAAQPGLDEEHPSEDQVILGRDEAIALMHELARLRVFEAAMRAMAAQFICPPTTATELAQQILKGENDGDK